MKQKIDAVIKDLREKGYKVKVTHYRRAYQDNTDLGISPHYAEIPSRWVTKRNGVTLPPGTALAPVGGRVTVDVTFPHGYSFQTEARCSMQDNFCRRTGTTIALGRAVKLINIAERQARANTAILG